MVTMHENVCLSFSKDLISFSCAFLFRREFSHVSSKTVIRYSDASMLKPSQALWQKLRLITSEDTARNIPFPPGSFLVFPSSFSRHDVHQSVGASVSVQDVPQQMPPSFLLFL